MSTAVNVHHESSPSSNLHTATVKTHSLRNLGLMWHRYAIVGGLTGILLFHFCRTLIPEVETNPTLSGYAFLFTLSTLFFCTIRLSFFEIGPHLVLKYFSRGGKVADLPTAEKVVHHMFSVSAHTFAGIYLYYTLSSRDWYYDDLGVWRGFQEHKQVYPMIDMLIYVLETGYHLNSMIMVWQDKEQKREDLVVIVLHHGVTVFLLLCSFQMHFIRIGLMVLLYHDLSDGLVGISKIFNYYKFKYVTMTSVIVMLLVWIWSRIWYFGRLILYSAVPLLGQLDYSYACVIALASLWLMHIYWFYLMAKIIKTMVMSKGKELRDYSEGKVTVSRTSSCSHDLDNEKEAPVVVTV